MANINTTKKEVQGFSSKSDKEIFDFDSLYGAHQ